MGIVKQIGLTDWNLIPKVQGMTDIPLNEGGESMFHLAHRIYSLLDELKDMPGDESYLLVTHGGIARCIHSYFYDMTNEEYSSFQLGNCEVREYIF